jgi:hypothetical protein
LLDATDASGGEEQMTEEMKTESERVKHKFLHHQNQIDSNTKILIIGTFNPCSPNNNADFFYSRQVKRPNKLWKLLPTAFGNEDLTGLNRVNEKRKFMNEHHIDFLDVIEELEGPVGIKNNFQDAYIDKHATKIKWRDVTGEMQKLRLDAACFTRSTFRDIPRINSQIIKIEASGSPKMRRGGLRGISRSCHNYRNSPVSELALRQKCNAQQERSGPPRKSFAFEEPDRPDSPVL